MTVLTESELEAAAELLAKLQDAVRDDQDLTDYGKDSILAGISAINDWLR